MSTEPGSNNPYSPPSAELDEAAGSRPGRIGWKIYFWVLLVLLGSGLLLIFSTAPFQPLDAVDLGATGIAFVGLFGYAFSRTILTRQFWVVWLPVQIVWDACVAFFLVPMGLLYATSMVEETSLLEDAINYAFIAPMYLSIFLYSSRSPDLWKSDLPSD